MGRCVALLLAGCMSVSALAAEAIDPDRQKVFDNLTVHYNTFNSTVLSPEIAAAEGLQRDPNLGTLNITPLKDGKPVPALLSGTIKELTGESTQLQFKHLSAASGGGYIAQYPVTHRATRDFLLTVTVDGNSHAVDFNQELFPGEQ